MELPLINLRGAVVEVLDIRIGIDAVTAFCGDRCLAVMHREHLSTWMRHGSGVYTCDDLAWSVENGIYCLTLDGRGTWFLEQHSEARLFTTLTGEDAGAKLRILVTSDLGGSFEVELELVGEMLEMHRGSEVVAMVERGSVVRLLIRPELGWQLLGRRVLFSRIVSRARLEGGDGYGRLRMKLDGTAVRTFTATEDDKIRDLLCVGT